MSSCDKLKALMTKNFILMKRNLFSTTCEVFFPIILMLLMVLIKSLFTVEDHKVINDQEFLKNNTFAYPSNGSSNLYGLNSSKGALYYYY